MKIEYKKVYLILICYLILYVFLSLVSPYFWLDEAGQIYMSLGLNHFSLPNSVAGTLSDAIRSNNEFNLDPGGFTILLFYWLKVSTNYVWVRLLPYLFFVLSSILLFKTSIKVYQFKNNYIYAIIVFIIPQLVFRSSEVRAYTMEFLSVVFSMYIIVNYKTIESYKLLIYSIIASLLITSRYSSVVLFGIISSIVLFNIMKSSDSFNKKLNSVLFFSLPLLISVSLIYWFILKSQNPGLNKVPYMEYLSDTPLLLLKKQNLIHTVSIIFLVGIFFVDKKISHNHKSLIAASFLINLTFITLSLLGFYPYNPFDERNLAIFLYTFLPVLFWFHITLHGKLGIINNYFFPVIFGLSFSYLFHQILSHNWRRNNLYNDISKYKFPSNYVCFVEKDLVPTTKYLFEFTPTGYTSGYPHNFIFLKGEFQIDDHIKLDDGKTYLLFSNRNVEDSQYEKIGFSLYKLRAK